MMFCFLRIFMRYIQADMVDCMNLHLIIDSSCNDVSWCERKTWVVFVHEFFTIRQTQNTAVTAHGFRNEVSRVCLAWVIKAGRVELHKFHIFDDTFGAMNHCYPVSGSNLRIRGCGINRACASGCHKGDAAEVCVNLLSLRIEDIGAIALNIRCTTCNAHS